MLFQSTAFVLFFAATFFCYYAAPLGTRQRVLLIASYVFYAMSGPRHLLVLLSVTIISHYLALHLQRRRDRRALAMGAALLLLPLLFYKYAALFAVGIGGLVLGQETAPGVFAAAAPLGISFFTLQALSYIYDVNQARVGAMPRLIDTALYLSFFPYILAGPIERAPHMFPQLTATRQPNGLDLYIGGKIFLWGLFAKLVIADNLASASDQAWLHADQLSTASTWLLVFTFSFRIFFDFVGYTSMARGAARCLGFSLIDNFRSPYASVSIQEFWRRWHISLSTWFRDYVYVPLGGKGRNALPSIVAVMAVFMFSGLWHGAQWGFLLWGILHAVMYLTGTYTERWRSTTISRLGIRRDGKMWKGFRILTTFAMVSLAWLPFQLMDIKTLKLAAVKLFSESGGFAIAAPLTTTTFLVAIAAAVLLVLLDAQGKVRAITESVPASRMTIGQELTLVNAMLILLLIMGDAGAREFLYFNF